MGKEGEKEEKKAEESREKKREKRDRIYREPTNTIEWNGMEWKKAAMG